MTIDSTRLQQAAVNAVAAGLTEQEAECLGLSALLWNSYLELPEQHPSDRTEVMQAVHAVQAKLLQRPVQRTMDALREPPSSPAAETPVGLLYAQAMRSERVLIGVLSRICAFAQLHSRDWEWPDECDKAKAFEHVSYVISCFLAQHAPGGDAGVESDIVLRELVVCPQSSAEWRRVIRQKMKEIAGSAESR